MAYSGRDKEQPLFLHHCDFVDIFMSPSNHHFHGLKSASLCNRSPSGICFTPLTILVALLWTSEPGSSKTRIWYLQSRWKQDKFCCSHNKIWRMWFDLASGTVIIDACSWRSMSQTSEKKWKGEPYFWQWGVKSTAWCYMGVFAENFLHAFFLLLLL